MEPSNSIAISASRPRIFISHKVLDGKLVAYFRDQLLALGLRSEEIFLSEETKPGTEWRPELLDAIKRSDTLVFIYTDPSYDWDWCLFECGFFAGIEPPNGQARSLICINSGIGRPSPLNLWQDVSSEQALELLLKSVAERIEAPLLGSYPAFVNFVKQFWTSIFRRLPLKDQGASEAFKQRRLAILVPAEEMAEIRGGTARDLSSSLSDAVGVEISDGARTIFPNVPLEAGWQQFLTALQDQPLQRNWMDSVPIMIRMLNGTRTESPMLPLVRDGLTPNVAYRPSVAHRHLYGDHSVRYTVVFIRTPEATVASAADPDRAFIWLMLARNFREAVLEPYQKKLETVQQAEELQTWAQDLEGQIALTRIDSVSRGLDIKSDAQLFSDVTNQTIGKLQKEWEACDHEFGQLQIMIAGIIAKNATSQATNYFTHAKAVLARMFAINAEFTLHVAGTYFGYVVRPRS